MNDPNLALSNLEAIIEATKDSESLVDRCALYSAMAAIVADLDRFIDEDHEGHAYAHENLERIRWSIAAALGFDITNGHDAAAHRSWAFGALSTLRSLLVS